MSKEIEYPCIMELEEEEGHLVAFTSAGVGVVIQNTVNNVRKVGYVSSVFIMSQFRLYIKPVYEYQILYRLEDGDYAMSGLYYLGLEDFRNTNLSFKNNELQLFEPSKRVRSNQCK